VVADLLQCLAGAIKKDANCGSFSGLTSSLLGGLGDI
jgi:hypothetical protein